jgi:NAD(P)-dependent dehydrogenase (short-subunit alcohol dehydrogenase family)
VAFSDRRFPVCPPLLRGPGDCASAMLGGMPFVMGFHDEPDRMHALLRRCSQTRLAVVRALQAVIPPWHETYAAGGYPSKLWCRRPVAYCQEDSAALLSPDLFRKFLLPLHREQCRAADVNFIHLHSTCLYPVKKLGGEMLYLRSDLSDRQQRKGLVAKAVKRFGRLDILVNGAGIQHRQPAMEFDLAKWDQIVSLMLTGVFELSQQAARVMETQGGGKIINIASLASFQGGLLRSRT